MRSISRASISMSLAWPSITPPSSGWCMRLRALGRVKRLPLVPAQASTLPMLAACPMM
jgi:hypothetical protein